MYIGMEKDILTDTGNPLRIWLNIGTLTARLGRISRQITKILRFHQLSFFRSWAHSVIVYNIVYTGNLLMERIFREHNFVEQEQGSFERIHRQ